MIVVVLDITYGTLNRRLIHLIETFFSYLILF